jgi:hypothetical protein
MLGVVIAAAVWLIGLVGYLIWNRTETKEGSQGPVVQSAPRSDPAPTFMQPGYRPSR